MPKQFANRVRFIEPVEVWGTKDAIDRNRFLEALFWASTEFDGSAKLDFNIVVIHCDKELGKFEDIGPYPASIRRPADPKSKMPYEVWLVGRVTDAMVMNALTEIYAHVLNITDSKAATAIGQRALNHLQSTISVKELERK